MTLKLVGIIWFAFVTLKPRDFPMLLGSEGLSMV